MNEYETYREAFERVFGFKLFPERLVETDDPNLKLKSWWDLPYESPEERQAKIKAEKYTPDW